MMRARTPVRILAVCGAVLAAIVITPAHAKKAAYIGEWTYGGSCAAGDGELEISAKKWSSVDFECTIKSVSGGKGTWRFKLHKCEGDGIGKTASVKVTASGNTLTQQPDGDQRYTLKRCK